MTSMPLTNACSIRFRKIFLPNYLTGWTMFSSSTVSDLRQSSRSATNWLAILMARCKVQGIQLEVDPEVERFISTAEYHMCFGARHLRGT